MDVITATKENKRVTELVLFTRFCRFLGGTYCRKFPISTGRNGRLKPGKSLNITKHIGNRTTHFSTDLRGAVGFQIGSIVLDSLGSSKICLTCQSEWVEDD